MERNTDPHRVNNDPDTQEEQTKLDRLERTPPEGRDTIAEGVHKTAREILHERAEQQGIDTSTSDPQ